jgi:hypothetical protein
MDSMGLPFIVSEWVGALEIALGKMGKMSKRNI